MKKRLSIIIAVVLGLALSVPILFYMGYKMIGITWGTSTSFEFTKEGWDTDIYNRDRMVKDLFERYDFLLMTRDEVIGLLGENRLIEHSFDESIGRGFLDYEIFGGFLNDEILVFEFDESGKIVNIGKHN